MLLECGHCGAPLDVKAGVAITKCKYCNTSSQTRRLKTMAQETPLDWKPPAVWVPPTNAPAKSVPLKYHEHAGQFVIWMVVLTTVLPLLIGLAIVVAVVSAKKKLPGAGGPGGGNAADEGMPISGLQKITLRETPQQMQKLTGVKIDDSHRMRVKLASKRYDAITFEWDENDESHVRQFYLNTQMSNQDAETAKAFKKILGRRFLKGESFRWQGAGIYYSTKGGILSVNVDVDKPDGKQEHPHWKKQVEALWAVVRVAALGYDEKVDPALVRDYLGGGYSLKEFTKLEWDADIDQSNAAMLKLFPGVSGRQVSGLDYEVALDHPWYGHMELSWTNKKGGKLRNVHLRPPPGDDNKFKNQKEIFDCVAATFGKPDKQYESDYLKGDRDYTWRPNGKGEIRVYTHLIKIELREYPFAPPMTKEVWIKTMETLDACGRT